MRTLSLIPILLGLTACDDGDTVDRSDAGPVMDATATPDARPDAAALDAGPSDGGADAGRVAYDTPPLPDYDQIPLPRLDDGRVFITSIAGFSLSVRPDAVTPQARVGRCAYTLIACLEAAGGDYDACVPSTPVCADPAYVDPTTPACCPAACAPAYAALRAEGTAPFDALSRVLGGADSCIPGVEAE